MVQDFVTRFSTLQTNVDGLPVTNIGRVSLGSGLGRLEEPHHQGEVVF